jgi:WD40 repeat protein
VTSVAVSPDGRHAFSASDDGTVAVWDLDTGEFVRTLAGHQGAVTSVAVSTDGRLAVSASYDDTVAVWDLDTGELLARIALDGQVLCLSSHPDDPFLVAGDRGGNLYGLEYHEP